MGNTAPAGAKASATPERGTFFFQIREARQSIGVQGALTAVRQLLQSQHQERRAMHEALGLVVKHTPDAKEAMRLLELKETPAAPLPVDDRIAALETRLAQLEAAMLETDEKAAAIFEARLDARVKDLERRYDALSEGAGGMPDEDAHERAEVEAQITAARSCDKCGSEVCTHPGGMRTDPDDSPEGAALEDLIGDLELTPAVDRRTMSTGEAA